MRNAQWRTIASLLAILVGIVTYIAIALVLYLLSSLFPASGIAGENSVIIGMISVAAGVMVSWWLYPKLAAIPANRRELQGLCRACGYDLRASPSGVCPECGVVKETPGDDG